MIHAVSATDLMKFFINASWLKSYANQITHYLILNIWSIENKEYQDNTGFDLLSYKFLRLAHIGLICEYVNSRIYDFLYRIMKCIDWFALTKFHA